MRGFYSAQHNYHKTNAIPQHLYPHNYCYVIHQKVKITILGKCSGHVLFLQLIKKYHNPS